MNPRNFFSFAKTLVEDTKSPSPELFRTAVGRVYYAAFNVAVEHLDDMGIRLKKKLGAHVDVRQKLRYSDNDNVKEAVRSLADLYDQRIDADYNLQKVNVENLSTVEMSFENAKAVIDILDKNCKSSSPERNKIETAIKKKIYNTENPFK